MSNFQKIQIDEIQGHFDQDGCFNLTDQFGDQISLATIEDFDSILKILSFAREAMLEKQEKEKNANTPLRLVA